VGGPTILLVVHITADNCYILRDSQRPSDLQRSLDLHILEPSRCDLEQYVATHAHVYGRPSMVVNIVKMKISSHNVMLQRRAVLVELYCRVEPEKSFSAMLNTVSAIPNDHNAEVVLVQ